MFQSADGPRLSVLTVGQPADCGLSVLQAQSRVHSPDPAVILPESWSCPPAAAPGGLLRVPQLGLRPAGSLLADAGACLVTVAVQRLLACLCGVGVVSWERRLFPLAFVVS